MALTRQPALRVAHLIETDGPGGAERVVAQLASGLQASGCANVAFLPGGCERWLTRRLEDAGVAVEHFRLERPVSPAFARWLASRLRAHEIDVAHSHEFSMAVYGGWAARRAGVPHVITMHGGRYYAGRLRRRLALRAAVALSGRTVAVSASLAEALIRDLRLRRAAVGTIPNGVAHVAGDPAPVRRELGLEAGDCLIATVGNLYPVKGQQYLVDACAALRQRYPRVHLAIAGRGELADALMRRAAEHGIGDRLHLLGLRDDVGAVLAAADVFVLPSLSEGLPLALLEAMFAARPIVATRVGEVPAALAGGDAGLLVEPGSAAALASAVERLLLCPDVARALAARAARRAHDHYGVSPMVKRYGSIYAQVAGAASGTPLGIPVGASLPW